MEQTTVSKTFGMTLRIEVDPENDHLLSKYFDGRYQRGSLHTEVARAAVGNGDKNPARRILQVAGLWSKKLTIDHINHNPADNRLVNLRMLTQSENLRTRRPREILFSLPAIPRLGLRLYAIEFTAFFDVENRNWLDRLMDKYQSGSMLRQVHTVLAGHSFAGSSLSRRVLSSSGVVVPKGLEVDHIDGDAGNNKRDNLRVVTRAQNIANRHNFKYPSALTV